MRPILSIVIPTKDRYPTLSNLVSRLMRWNQTNFEVVIQDNSENEIHGVSLAEQYAGDDRFKYFYQSGYLSAIQNCQLAIENSRGNYVCFLGDDDGILSHSIEICSWMLKNNIDSLSCKHGNYLWPEYRVKNYSKRISLAGALIYRENTGSLELLSPLKELDTVLNAGGLIMNKITRVYHGIISRSSLDKVKDKTGTFFPGPVPDMTSSVALSFYVDKHVYLNYPLIIAGASKNSMAGRGGQRKAHGKIEDEKSLPPDTINKWSKQIPRYWAPNTIWPEGMLQALKETENSASIQKVDFLKIYAALYLDTPSFRPNLLKFIKETCGQEGYKQFNKTLIKMYVSNFKNKIKHGMKVISIYLGAGGMLGFKCIYADDIAMALEQLEANTNLLLKEESTQFSDIINSGECII